MGLCPLSATMRQCSCSSWGRAAVSGPSSSSSSSSASVIYYYVTLDVDDPDNMLLPAMTARVEINTAEKSDALVVPLSTLKTDAKEAPRILAFV